jgi:hypothetical protein
MSDNTEKELPAIEAEAKDESRPSVVDAVFDVAEAWAAYGLNVAKLALQTSAKTLEKTAKALGDLQTSLEKEEDAKDAA